MSEHTWVNNYETCERCNYGRHICPLCGEDLDHESYDPDGNRHWLSDCRPDLVQHEPGELCTWPWQDDCYAYDENHEHVVFYKDGPMT